MARYDLVVIGSGPAGEKGAAQAAYFGKRVALVEKCPQLGGACVNTGTIPSKTLRETCLHLSGFRQRGLPGLPLLTESRTLLGPRDLMARKQAVVEAERERMRANLERHHVEVVHGTARFVDPHAVEVTPSDASGAPRRLEAEKFLVAVGSSPHHPPNVPFESPLVH